MCSRRLNGGPLACTNSDPNHDPNGTTGHTYAASWTPDNHDRTEAQDD